MNPEILAGPWAPVLALASYRLTRLWLDDMLPPLPRVRAWVQSRATRWSRMYRVQRWPKPTTDAERERESAELDRVEPLLELYAGQPALSLLATCYWCSGFWIALAVVLVAVLAPVAWWAVPMAALALSATTGLLSKLP